MGTMQRLPLQLVTAQVTSKTKKPEAEREEQAANNKVAVDVSTLSP